MLMVRAVVSRVRVAVCGDWAPPVNASWAGEKLQLAYAGSVPQENFSVPVYPFKGVTVNVTDPVLPRVMVSDGGALVIEKSGVPVMITCFAEETLAGKIPAAAYCAVME